MNQSLQFEKKENDHQIKKAPYYIINRTSLSASSEGYRDYNNENIHTGKENQSLQKLSPKVTKTEFLLTISIQYLPDKS